MPNTKDEKILRDIIHDICTWDNNTPGGRKHMHDSCVFIRPSGNPLNMAQWDAMMKNKDVTNGKSRLVKINSLRITENMAIACYTSHSQFNYKGVDNDDVAVFTGVFEKFGFYGEWKLIHGQRSTGRKPSEELPVFE